MSVKTIFSEKDFRKILADYDLGEYKNFQHFKHGWVHTTALITTSKGKFVFKYYENRPKKHVLFEAKLLNFLIKKKYPIAKVIKNSSEKFLGRYNKKPYLLFEYVTGKSTKNPNHSINRQALVEVIKTIAKLHKITRKYKPAYLLDHHVYDTKYCWKKYKTTSTKQNKAKEKWLQNELKQLRFPALLSKQIVHCDFNYSNFLFRNNKIVALLDFDMSCYHYLIYDIANLIYWWALNPKKGVRIKRASFILKTYFKYNKINHTEQKYIFDALKLIILLGFVWDKNDAFNETKKLIESLNSLGRENFYKKLFR